MPTSLTTDDRFEIADLAARYAAAVDSRSFDDLRNVFVADCRLDTGRSVREGIDEVLDAMEGLRRYEATSHVVGQQLLDASGDDVTGVTYCTAHHLTDHGDHHTDRVMHIRYHDQFVRTDEGWRVSSRRLEVPWTDDRPVNAAS